MDAIDRCAVGFFLIITWVFVLSLSLIVQEVGDRVDALEDLEIQKTKEICIHKVVGE